MPITRKNVAEMILKYINRELSLSNLVDWAEDTMMESDFEDQYFDIIRNIVSRIGLADVEEFGLSWDDCYDYLHGLGYSVKVETVEA